MMKSRFFLVALISVTLGSSVFAQTKPVEPVLQDFRKWAQSEGFDKADVQSLRVTDDYVTQHNQVRHLYIQQVHKGIGIVNTNAAVHVWKGQVISRHQNLVKGLAAKSSTQASIDASEALRALARHHNWSSLKEIKVESLAKGVEQKGTFAANGIAYDAIPFQLVYYASEKGKLNLGWNLQVHSLEGQHYYNSIVDASSGKILFEEDWVLKCNVQINHTHEADAHMNLFEEEFMHGPRVNSLEEANMMTAQYRVLAIPTESPNHGPYVLVQDPSNADASPFGWHDTDGVAGPEFTITRGNNVFAEEDRDGDGDVAGDGGPDFIYTPGFTPDGGANLSFDFIYDTNAGPIVNQEAVITNLFYMNNIMHDVWYQYGFDEAGGNFQQNNYGKGGIGGDAVQADAQDRFSLGATNNATFGTPPEGRSGFMSMFIWPSGDPGVGGVTVNSPSNIAKVYTSLIAGFGDRDIADSVTAELVLVDDGTGNSQGCGGFINGPDLSGKIAVIDRGTCEFGTKALNAQNGGAVGVIVINNVPGGPAGMAAGADGSRVTIPVFMISQEAGDTIRVEIPNGVNVTLTKPELAATDRDSDLDNGIIAHEYGHGISNRLTGGPAAAGCLSNQEQAGEGWSDWFSLVMQVKPGDQGSDSRGIGTYASGQRTDGGGIRTYPYSTDFNINPFTYDDIKAAPVTQGGVSSHFVGSIMCTMLWDLYWAMTDEYGYDNDIYYGTGGNNMAMRLVIDGMKLQPCNPGFVDVRNAILLADKINYGSVNERLIWEVFARRGLGASADQGLSSSVSDGIEAFDLPDAFKPILYMTKEVDKNAVENGDSLTFTFFVRNQKSTVLNNVIVRDTLANDFSYLNNSATANINLNGNIISINLGTLTPEQDTTFSFKVLTVNTDPFMLPDFEDDLEGDVSEYRNQGRGGNDEWVISINNSNSPVNSWFVPNVSAENDQALITPIITLPSSPVLSFWHYYDTEAGWDGGIIEILVSGRWEDLKDKILVNPYNGSLQSNNPMGERAAFTGKSNGWIQTKVDLTEYAGLNTAIAFRFGSDKAASEEGWYVDDILIQNEYISTNAATVYADEGDTYRSELDKPIAIEITDIANSVKDLPSEVALNLYPNPAKQLVTLEYLGTNVETLEIEFRNTLGQMVKTLEMRPFANSASKQIDISNLPAGIYNILISQGDNRTIKKLLVE